MKEFVNKLISRLKKERKRWNDNIDFLEQTQEYQDRRIAVAKSQGYSGAYFNAIEIVNELAEEYINTSIDTSSGWIPCGKKLPDESGEYLTFVEYEGRKFIAIDDIDCDGTFKKWNCTSDYHIIAWQPLPNIPSF